MSTPTQTRPAAPGLPASAPASNTGASQEGAPKPRSGRGRRPGTQPKERPAIPADLFVIEEVAEEERGKFKRAREERSAEQQAVDTMVMETYKKWKDAGRPKAWGRMPIRRWQLPPNLVDTATFLLGKAAALHGLRLYYGQKGIVINGKYQMTFCVTDKRTKVTDAPVQ